MDNHEAQTFVASEVQTRFPDTTWTETLALDWEYACKKLDRRAALSAIRTLQAESKVKKPALGKFVKMAQMLCSSRSPTRTEYFIQYQGGNKKCRLNAGYFFQIITTEQDYSQVAHSTRAAMECMHGGTWEVITNTNWSEMIAQRWEFSKRQARA